MSAPSYSILREEEYRMLARMSFRGRVLDIGGSKRSGYHELLKGAEAIITANIDPAYGCDMVFDAEKRFPIDDDSYDHIVALNLLEHLYRFHNIFSESARILKPGGTLVFTVPFLFQIHGSPDDYFRYTRSALERLCRESGFKEVYIAELGFGIFSLLFQTVGGAIPTRFLKEIFKKTCRGVDRVFLRLSKKYRTQGKRIPLGYFLVATK